MTRAAVYAAEQSVADALDREIPVRWHGSLLHPVADRKFADIPSIQRYVAKVVDLLPAWDLHPVSVPTVRERKGHAAAHYERGKQVIAVPMMREGRWAARELVVLHELAHHIDATTGGQGHGPSFCRIHAHLVSKAVEGPAGLLLLSRYDEAGLLEVAA